MQTDDAWSAVAGLAASQHGVLTRKQAADHLSHHRIRTALADGRLDEPVHGVLVLPGSPPTFSRRLAVATAAGGGTNASHRAAALLQRFDGVEAAPVEVTVRRGRYPAIDGVVVHRSTPLGAGPIARTCRPRCAMNPSSPKASPPASTSSVSAATSCSAGRRPASSRVDPRRSIRSGAIR